MPSVGSPILLSARPGAGPARVACAAGRHLSEEALEEYLLGRLSEVEAQRLEDHLVLCSACQIRSGDTDIVGQALSVVMGKAAISLTHDTKCGPLHLRVTNPGEKTWIARFSGSGLDGQSQFDDLTEANQWLVQAFGEIFPEHRCTRRCVRHT